MRSAAQRSERTAQRSERTTRELAELRALAIMNATEMVLEGAQRRPSWREFEYEWFLRRIEEARRSLEGASPRVRLAFVDGLRATSRSLREAAAEKDTTGTAAGLMLEALDRLRGAFEGRDGRPLTTSEQVYSAAERMRRAGGFPFFNTRTRTVDRLPKAKAIGGSVWVVHQKPGRERSYVLSHGPSGTEVTLPTLPKPKLEQIARAMAEELPDFATDASLIHEIEGGPLGTRLEGGIPLERHRELYAARDRAITRASVSWGSRP